MPVPRTPPVSGDPSFNGRAALLAAAWQELTECGTAGLSLRAVARRAGVSHAAPKHHFGDRAGLLTALAVEGYQDLQARFQTVLAAEVETDDHLGILGRTYLDFSLDRPEMFEVMFGTEPLDENNSELAFQRRALFGLLGETVAQGSSSPLSTISAESLMTWAFIHGLVGIIKNGGLQRITGGRTPEETTELAKSLSDAFSSMLRSMTHPLTVGVPVSEHYR